MEKKLKLGPLGMNIELPGGQNMPVPVLHADIIGPLGNPESRKLAKELVERYNAHEELIILLKGFLKETSGKKTEHPKGLLAHQLPRLRFKVDQPTWGVVLFRIPQAH